MKTKKKKKKIWKIAIVLIVVLIFSSVGAIFGSFSSVKAFGYLPGKEIEVTNTNEYIWGEPVDSTELGSDVTTIDGGQALVNMAMKELEIFTSGQITDGSKYQTWGGGNTSTSWCSAFVYYCAEQCGFIGNESKSCFGPDKVVQCGESWKSMEQMGYKMYYIRKSGIEYKPVTGDLVYYLNTDGEDFPTDGMLDHMGIVKEVDSNGHMWVIEGNIDNNSIKVVDRTATPYNNNADSIFGYCHPDYPSVISSGSLASGIWQFDSNKDNIYNVYTFLRIEMGYNVAACAGVMANINVESASTWNPAIEEYGRPLGGNSGLGLIQWSYGRRTDPDVGLLGWCAKNGYEPLTIEGNMRFLQYELENKSYKDSVHAKILLVSDTIEGSEQAAGIWVRHFEISRDKDSGYRESLARSTWYAKALELEKLMQSSIGNSGITNTKTNGTQGITYDSSLLIIGDSNTVRWHSWSPDIANSVVYAKVGVGVTTVSSMKSEVDCTSITMLDAINNSKGFSSAVILLGTNNLGLDGASYKSNMKNIINPLYNNNTDIVINLCTLLPVYDFKGNVTDTNVKKINTAITELVSEYEGMGRKIHLIDIYSDFVDSSNNMLKKEYQGDSGYHLSKAGTDELTTFIKNQSYK